MKRFLVIALAALSTKLTASCSELDTPARPKVVDSAKVRMLTKDFDRWYRYTRSNVLLARNFEALDTAGQPLTKGNFLRQLATDKVLAVVITTGRKQPVYQLCRYPDGQNSDVWATSKQLAKEELNNCSREGQRLPDFKFVDLKSVTYTKSSIKGKIVVIKFWYTSCIACVDEFPEINALADKYQQNKDVLFVSLAMNKAESLREFLRGREVKFAVVPASKAYLVDTLKVTQYPTHFILGRDGRIAKVTTNASDLAVALQQEVQSR